MSDVNCEGPKAHVFRAEGAKNERHKPLLILFPVRSRRNGRMQEQCCVATIALSELVFTRSVVEDAELLQNARRVA